MILYDYLHLIYSKDSMREHKNKSFVFQKIDFVCVGVFFFFGGGVVGGVT